MSEPIDTAIDAAGKTAGLVVDQGMLVMVGVIVLATMASGLWLVVRYWNRKISGEYIPISEAEQWLKKNKPELVLKPVEEMPDLRKHRFFTEATRQMRAAESANSPSERDLAVWTIRGNRDVIADILNEAYTNKDGFNKYIGDATSFRSRFDEAITEVQAAVKYRLVTEFGFPAQVFSKWQQEREFFDEIMTNMLDIASERETSYYRLQSVLDSQYARIIMLRKAIQAFIHKEGVIEYNSPSGADASTIASGMQKTCRTPTSYPAALFERNRKI
jgi:hypothetical protein